MPPNPQLPSVGKKKIEIIDYSIQPRRAMGGGHVEGDLEDALEILKDKINEIIERINDGY
ncbi:MAG: hypothetical protein ACRDFB_08805 [Rhabdochlamydiaceae bacterium]